MCEDAMEWQRYAECEPMTRSEETETLMNCLAGLGLAPDVLAQIHGALGAHFGADQRLAVSVFAARRNPARTGQDEWRFFIVVPGTTAPNERSAPHLELYLY
jgi:hypothetical protein